MQNWTSVSRDNRPFRLNTLAGALALAFMGGASGGVQAVPLAPLAAPFKLNSSPPERILSVDVELNSLGAGVALWQRHNEDGRYAINFRRFDRYGNVAALQIHERRDTPIPAHLLKVFDNGEFAIESRQGTTVTVTIRSRSGGVARTLNNIQCRTANCSVVMDDAGKLIVGDVATVSGQVHPAVQLLDSGGRVTRPWFIVDQPATGVREGQVLVAADTDGDFAVAWGQDHVFARQFQKTGQAKGPQFQVADLGAFDDFKIAMDDDGDFAVAWNQQYFTRFHIEYTIAHKLYRKDGTLAAQGVDAEGLMPNVGGRDGSGLMQIVMDNDGDYAQLHDILADYDDYLHVTPSLGLTLSRRFTNTRLGTRTLSKFKVDLSDWQALPDTSRPVQFGDIAMDGNGHLASLWVRKVGSVGDPVGLYLQRFTGPLGEGCGGAGATLIGTDAANTINGSAGDDVIHGKGGNDVIHGNGGNDVICGGAGLDRLYGDAGLDRLFGDSGADQLFGGDGNDYLNGGLDTDIADGGPGTDTCLAESLRNCP